MQIFTVLYKKSGKKILEWSVEVQACEGKYNILVTDDGKAEIVESWTKVQDANLEAEKLWKNKISDGWSADYTSCCTKRKKPRGT